MGRAVRDVSGRQNNWISLCYNEVTVIDYNQSCLFIAKTQSILKYSYQSKLHSIIYICLQTHMD